MHKLTKVDKILITELLNDARISIQEISKKHRISRTSIIKRMKILEEKEILGRYMIDFNPSLVGIICVDILIKTKKIPELNLIKKLFQKSFHIAGCLLCTGPFNIQIRCYVCELKKIPYVIETINSLLEVQDFDYTISIGKTYFSRDFFDLGVNINKIYGPFYYDITINKKCKKTDLKILTSLTKNSRMSLSEIAKKIKIPMSTTNFNFKRLKKEGVIERFSAFTRVAFFGYDIDMIRIRLKVNNPLIEKKLFRFCKNCKKIFVYEKLFGKWDYRIQLFVKSLYETYSITRQLQDEIPEIDRLDIFRVYEGYSQPIVFEEIVK